MPKKSTKKMSSVQVFVVSLLLVSAVYSMIYFVEGTMGYITVNQDHVGVPPLNTVTAEYGKPDLVISDISWVYVNGGYGITVTIKNQGSAKASNFEVMTKDTTNNVELLQPNQNNQMVRCKLTVAAGQTGKCSYNPVFIVQNGQKLPFAVQATADTPQKFGIFSGVVMESNENNNVLSTKVTGCTFTTIGKCGNGVCDKEKNPGAHGCPDRSETSSNCFEDCIKCGDGNCEIPEMVYNGYVGEDGVVNKWECKADCGYVWGDGTCDKNEAGTTAGFIDCTKCGDGNCDRNEFKDTASMKNVTDCKNNPKICRVCAADC